MRVKGSTLIQAGDKWTESSTLTISGWESIEQMQPPSEEMFGLLKVSLQPIGVRAVADRTYIQDTQTASSTIILRVFIFESEEKCRQWWALKYESAEASEIYDQVKDAQYVAADVKGRQKRAGSGSNVFFSVQQLGQGLADLRVANLVVDLIL